MTARLRTARRARLRDDDGASAVEYGLLVVAIAAVIVAVAFALGAVTRGQYSVTCDAIASAQGESGC
jgi:pilus assembly protein Flp/PilA